MTRRQRHLITALILVLALVFYGVGFSLGAIAIIAIGAILELVFWVRLVGGESRQASNHPS